MSTKATITTARTSKLKLHRDHGLVPEMRPEEYEELLEDIGINGILTPIDVGKDGVTILDGKHRFRAARELGLKRVPIRIAQLGTNSSREYILKAAILRRHLTDDQRAMVAAYLSEKHTKRGGDRRSEKAQRNQSSPRADLKGKAKRQPALAEEAEKMKVSKTKAGKAKKVLNANPKLAKEVHDGKTKLNEAIKQVSRKKKPKTFSSRAGKGRKTHWVACVWSKCKEDEPPEGKVPKGLKVHSRRCLRKYLATFEAEQKSLLKKAGLYGSKE